MDLDWLFEAYHQTRKNGAAGIDGVTAGEYEQDLEGGVVFACPFFLRNRAWKLCLGQGATEKAYLASQFGS